MGKKAQDGIIGINGVDNSTNTPHLKARNWGNMKDREKIDFILEKLYENCG